MADETKDQHDKAEENPAKNMVKWQNQVPKLNLKMPW